MVGQSLWKNLKNMVNLDKQLDNLNKEVKQTEKILQKDHDSIPKLESLIEEQKKNYLSEKKEVALQELTAKELKEKEVEKKKRLEEINNAKEYKAVEKELKRLSQQSLEQDDTLIKAWHQLEIIEKKFKESKKTKEEQIIQLREGIGVQKEALKDLTARKEEFVKKRNEFSKIIPEEWLNKYERMRHKVDDPIVPVLGSSCSACYYSILRQDLSQLKKSGVLPCRNCYRFLYYDEAEEKDAKSENF